MEKQQKLRPVVAGALRLAAGNTLRVANVASVTAAHTNTNARIFACSYIHTNIHTSPSETKNAKACFPLKGKEVTSREGEWWILKANTSQKYSHTNTQRNICIYHKRH